MYRVNPSQKYERYERGKEGNKSQVSVESLAHRYLVYVVKCFGRGKLFLGKGCAEMARILVPPYTNRGCLVV